MEKRILITGGSGFIGTNMVEFYLNKDINVLSIDIVKPRHKSHLNYFENVNICNKKELLDCVSKFKPTHVIHLAAKTDLRGSNIEDYKANTKGVLNVIDAICSTESVVRTIFASSMLVCKAGYKPVDGDDYKPDTLYGESKVCMEKYIKNNTKIKSMWNIIRPTSIWGPWFRSPYSDFFNMIIKNRYVNIHGKMATKTFGYVENAVFQIDKILLDKGTTHNKEIFYIGDRPPVNIAVWANEIAYALKNKKILAVPFFIFKTLALIGDFLGLLGLSFPMSSFRLANMTNDNVQNLDKTYLLTGEPPIKRSEGIKRTLAWINTNSEPPL